MQKHELINLQIEIKEKEALLKSELNAYAVRACKFRVMDIVSLPENRYGKIFSIKPFLFLYPQEIKINIIGLLCDQNGRVNNTEFKIDEDQCELFIRHGET